MASTFLSSMPTLSLPSTSTSISTHNYHSPFVSFNIISRKPMFYKLRSRTQHQFNQKPATTVTFATDSTTLEEDVDTESTTDVAFPKWIYLPGCTSPLQLIGKGFREKTFAIIKVNVYAVGLYVDPSISTCLSAWKGRSVEDLTGDANFWKAAAEAPVNKGIRIVLVRDVDGGTFWEAMNDTLAPRIKSFNGAAADEEALKNFGSVFLGRSLKQGNSIYLTWLYPSTLEVAISDDYSVPDASDASLDSSALTLSLFDVYLGEDSVSPSAKTSSLIGIKDLL